MTRNFLMTSTTIATLIAAPMAMASNDSASDLTGNSPAITEGGQANAVGSISNGDKDVPLTRQGIGIAEYDPTSMSVTTAQYNALVNAIGGELTTTDDVFLGDITEVTFDGQGNPEVVVDLIEDVKIDAETLVLTLLPESMMMIDGTLVLDTTIDELYLKAQDGSKRDDETRTTVIVM
ncbi:hypothetical protein [Sulfitobacter aestuariivivens]|uniref:PRC-barrel domain-containing protein n=1 Tax=Sulfitobacter aestuariivivens TaxID=2766981 RepID=A0A927D1S4_9RHOB|nr:hypothetical protein [Sulfitobacter aestuariivivens]MBD3663498.1 hypothetical protein [Sulfitobacter aestuariivivens]